MPLREINPAKHQRPAPPSGQLGSIERAADAFGLVETPAIKTALKTARALAEREAEIEADRRALRATDNGRALATAYLNGDVTLDDVIASAARARLATEPRSAEAMTVARTLDGAIGLLAQQAHAALSKPGDDWLRALRPEFDRRLDVALDIVPRIPAAVSDEIGARTGDRAVHRAWLELTEALAAVDEIHDTVDAWRNAGLVPVRGAVHNDDLRWLHVDRLRGNTARRVGFFCHNVRLGAEPGLWTETELAAAAAELEPAGAA